MTDAMLPADSISVGLASHHSAQPRERCWPDAAELLWNGPCQEQLGTYANLHGKTGEALLQVGKYGPELELTDPEWNEVFRAPE